jgi:hypothetical protein
MDLVRWPASGGSCSAEESHDEVSLRRTNFAFCPPGAEHDACFHFHEFGGLGAERHHSQFEVRVGFCDIITALQKLAEANEYANRLLPFAVKVWLSPDLSEKHRAERRAAFKGLRKSRGKINDEVKPVIRKSTAAVKFD